MEDNMEKSEGFFRRCCRAGAFLLKSLRHPIRMGAPLPCNRDIADTIREELEAVDAKDVLELGAGTGALTRGVLEAVPEDGRVMCVEQEELFCEKLRDRFGDRIELVQGNAVDLDTIVEGTVWESADAIVCSVPFIIDESDQLVQAIHRNLPQDGLYLQVSNFRDPVDELFEVQKTYTFRTNIPPEKLHSAVHCT
ncbi:MAG: class I SAM-dependent methyltransferase [Planctomycetota bacterium]